MTVTRTMIRKLTRSSVLVVLLAARLSPLSAPSAGAAPPAQPAPLHVYTLNEGKSPDTFDEAMAVACLQGLINRDSPALYVIAPSRAPTRYWLDILSRDGRWLEGRERRHVPDLDALVKLAGGRLRGAVVWDPAVPATFNVATTIAGASDGVVLSAGFADRYQKRWGLPLIRDLRGMFTGSETGSKKNDAYRWAIREYLAKGLCSSRLICLYQDPWDSRAAGDTSYVVPRDLAVARRAFVFDLSPWGDEAPADDPSQKPGTDLATYQAVLDETLRQAAGRHMTEMSGFFHFGKYSRTQGHASAHGDIPTEFRTQALISPSSVYQNTLAAGCCNQSLHSLAPRKPLKQRRPAVDPRLEKKTYVCIFMGDFDSVLPVYEFLPKFWDSPVRGKFPLAWGVNPNLLETCPDLLAYFYSKATPNDTFVSDAGAAGYIHPSRIRAQNLPLFVEQSRRLFREADMSIAPMVVDVQAPPDRVKDAYLQFAPDGLGADVQPRDYDPYVPDAFPAREWHVWKGMPVIQLTPGQDVGVMAAALAKDGGRLPAFHLFRVVWESPEHVERSIAELRQKLSAANVEVVDPYRFFALFKQWKSGPK